MLTYLILIGLLGFFAFIQSSGFNDLTIVRYKRYLNGLTFAILLLFIGLRYKVGADWYQYFTYYNSVESLSTIIFSWRDAPYFYYHPWEPAFKLLCVIVKSLGLSFQGLVFVVSAFNLYSLNRFLRKHLNNEMCIFLILFISLNMLREFDILRQSLAFYIILFAYDYINKSFFKYLGICIIACFFHISAIVFIPAYFLFNLKLNRKFLILTFILFSCTLILKLKFLTIIVDVFEKILPGGFSELLFHQVKLYLELFPLYSNINFVTLISLALLGTLIIFFRKIDLYENKFLISFIIFIYISIIFSEVGEVQSRFGYFFSLGLVYCLARTMLIFKGYARMSYVIVMVMYSSLKIILPLRLEATLVTYTPYRNYIFYFDQNEAAEKEIMLRFNKAQELNQGYFENSIKN